MPVRRVEIPKSRSGRKAHDAVKRAQRHVEEGFEWVVDRWGGVSPKGSGPGAREGAAGPEPNFRGIEPR
jgi:hypothetical protein